MEAPAVPPVPDSAEATAARAYLLGVEKHLDSEGLLFNQETVQLLKNAIKAIRELEKKRKHTIDLLEEETIKNSHLRVKIKGYPEFVMQEFEELVAAARRFRFHKLTEMEETIQETVQAVEATYLKQEFSEKFNVILCDEQKELRAKFNEMVHFMNERMGAKQAVCIDTNDLHNLIREEEDEIQLIERYIREVKAEMEKEAIEFRQNKAILDAKIADIRRKIKDQKLLTAERREEYAALCAELEAHEQEISTYRTGIASLRELLAEIFKKIRDLIREYEEKKEEKEELLKKRAQLKTEESEEDEVFDEERDELLRKISEAEEKLAALMKVNSKLKEDYNLLNTQYQALLAEEEEARIERDRLAKEHERLSNQISNKLDRIGKRLLEARNLQDELDRLQEVYNATQSSYIKQIGDLEATLQKESEKRATLQEQLAEITARYKKMLEDHEELVNSSKQQITEKRKLLAELIHKNEQLKNELQHALDTVNQLTEKLRRREAYYKKRDADLEAEIKALEEELNSLSQLVKEKEEQLSVNRPLAEQLQKELEEKTATLSNQKDAYTALLEEERTLHKSIERSLREIAKLKRMKLTAKSELQAKRETLLEELSKFMRSLRIVEKDNYELDRVMYILNAENDRLRAGILFLREDIADLEIDAEHYRSQRQKSLKEVKTIYDRFDAKWLKDRFLYQMFLNYEYEVMNRLTEDITKYKKRIETVTYVQDGLQQNCKAMQIVFKGKSAIASHSRNEETPKTVTWS